MGIGGFSGDNTARVEYAVGVISSAVNAGGKIILRPDSPNNGNPYRLGGKDKTCV